MRERDVAALIEADLRRVGFDTPAFDTIVSSGPNSAILHYRAGLSGAFSHGTGRGLGLEVHKVHEGRA